MGDEIKLSEQSKAILEKLKMHMSDTGLTETEVARIRAVFMREDNTKKAIIFVYNAIIKLATLLAALSGIWFFFFRSGK